jgi:hypothetical protein
MPQSGAKVAGVELIGGMDLGRSMGRQMERARDRRRESGRGHVARTGGVDTGRPGHAAQGVAEDRVCPRAEARSEHAMRVGVARPMCKIERATYIGLCPDG